MRGAIYTGLWVAIAIAVDGSAAAAPKHELSAAAVVDSSYDSNVYNGRGPDYVNRINPWANWRLYDERAKIETGYQLGYWTYALGKAQNSLNHRAAITVEGRLSRRVTLKAADELTRADDPGFLLRAAVVAPQIGIIFNLAEASAVVDLTRRLYSAAGYQLQFARFDPYTPEQAASGLAPLFDGAEHKADLRFGYKVTRSDDFTFAGRYQYFSAGPQAESISRWSLANTYSPSVGWRHRFHREVELTADAGPLYYQTLDGASQVAGAPQISGWTWRLGTRLRFTTPTWRAALSYTRDLFGATGAGTALWADALYAQVGYHHLSRLDLHAGGGYFRNGRAVDQPFGYDGFTADALVDVRVIDNLRLGAYYTLRFQETGPGALPPGAVAAAFPSITRNVVGIRLMAVIGADARPPRREVRE